MTNNEQKDSILLFVYGTLMRGQHANYMLEGCEYLGRYKLDGYVLYDLGSFPAIRPTDDEGYYVPGELYSIPLSKLPELDRYEGSGYLYTRTGLEVSNGSEKVKAWVYVYNTEPDAPIIQPYLLPYKSHGPKDYVWYVSYGSNMLEERFMCYIAGGECRFNGVTYVGCKNDTTPPITSVRVTVPHKMYYAGNSGSWGGGVAYLEPESGGECMGRAWLIKKSQYDDVQEQEGPMYKHKIELGTIDGIKAFTFTHETKLKETGPSASYSEVIVLGKKETYQLPFKEIIPDRT